MASTATLASALADYTDLRKRDIQDLLAMQPEAVLKDPRFNKALHNLDSHALQETLHEARTVLQESLPAVTNAMQRDYQLDTSPMSAYTLGNWIVGFVERPDELHMLMNIHSHLPQNLFGDYLTDLLILYDELGPHAALWQKSMATLAIPMIAAG